MKWLKFLLIPLILFFVGYMVTLFPINGNNFLPLIAKTFHEQTGLDFISQKVVLRIGKDVLFDFQDADINYNKSKKLAHLKNTKIKIPLCSILKKNYTVSEIIIDETKTDIILSSTGEFEFLKYVKLANGFQHPHKIEVKKYSVSLGKSHKIIGNDFQLKDNKINLKANLYIDNVDKMFIKGVVTNFEKPKIDIRLKTDSILLSDVYTFATMFYPQFQKYDIKVLSGSITADVFLKGNLNNLKSSGFLKVINAKAKCANYYLQDFVSDIDLSNNKIFIKNTKGVVNDAPISINGNIISNKVDLNIFMDKFKLKNYKYDKLKINSANITANVQLKGNYKQLKPTATVLVEDVRGCLPYQSFSIPAISAKVLNNVVDFQPFKFVSNNAEFETVGKVQNINNDKLSFEFKTKGNILPKELVPTVIINEKYPTICIISGDKKAADIRLQVLQEKPNPKVGFVNPVIFNIASKYKNNILTITDCGIYSYNKIFTQNLKSNIASSKKLCEITGSINNEVPNLKILISKPVSVCFTHYLANLQGNVSVMGKKISGVVKIPAFNDKYGHISAKKIYAEINNKNIMFNTELLRLVNNQLSCAGQLALENKNIVVKTMNVKAQQIDSESLSAIMMLSKYFGLKPIVEKATFTAEKMLVKTHINNYLITKLSSSFKINNQKIYMTNIIGNMYNGKIGGNLIANIDNGVLTGTIQGRGLSSGIVAQMSTKLKEKISGNLDFDMDIKNTTLNSKFLKNANIKFIINNGQMSILGKVEHLLYAQNIIADNFSRTSLAVVSRAISARDTGLFNYINGILNLNEDNVSILSMKMQGPNMSMYIKGKYNLISNIANVNILGRLSDTMISSLGAFGTFTMENFRTALSGEETNKENFSYKDIDQIPEIPQRKTKEFKAQIYGLAEDKSAVRTFKWISTSQKDYRVKEIPHSNIPIPKFVDEIN